jgi:hypothetical protein
MDGPANSAYPPALLVRIEGNVPWMWRKASGGNYVAICEPLKITLQARSYCELMEDISNSLDALLKELVETHDFDRFMQDQGWHLAAPLPPRPKDMRFDVPFSIMPVAAGTNGSQRHLHQ